jgi:hypothetical protein
MTTIEKIPAADPDTEAIIQSLITGKPLPAEIRNRLREEGRKLTQEIRDKIGETNMAVDLIREIRDE